jgi:hypothetical protein
VKPSLQILLISVGCCSLAITGCNMARKPTPSNRTETEAEIAPKEQVKQANTVPILIEWRGDVKLEARKDLPTELVLDNTGLMAGFITNHASWEKLWKVCRANGQLPSVNFKEAIIYAAVNSDPNGVSVFLKLDDRGDLQGSLMTQLVEYTNPTEGSYLFALVNRDGIKTMNGKEIKKD